MRRGTTAAPPGGGVIGRETVAGAACIAIGEDAKGCPQERCVRGEEASKLELDLMVQNIILVAAYTLWLQWIVAP